MSWPAVKGAARYEATPTEPHEFGWDALDRLAGGWQVVERREYGPDVAR